eukprot:5560423-Amphidinium_carterae.2
MTRCAEQLGCGTKTWVLVPSGEDLLAEVAPELLEGQALSLSLSEFAIIQDIVIWAMSHTCAVATSERFKLVQGKVWKSKHCSLAVRLSIRMQAPTASSASSSSWQPRVSEEVQARCPITCKAM